MAQSKKNLLKRVDRECRRLNPKVRYLAAQLRRHDLADEFGSIWGETYEVLSQMQRVQPGDLQRPSDLLPVTYQQASLLRDRLQTFIQRMPSSR
jgi:hypothetical protein